MRLGIIQGRLTKPTLGFQECPLYWREEIGLLSNLDLEHVEWIITDQRFEKNPIFDRNETLQTQYISSVCFDFFVVDDFLHNRVVERFEMTCKELVYREIKNATIPLLENSSVVNPDVRDKFSAIYGPIFKKYEDIMFSLEAELDCNELLEIVSLYDNVYITYDTGNMTSHGVDHSFYITTCASKINNVHLKDRFFTGESVFPGTGDTDFSLIFKLLKLVGYNGVYSLQTARGKVGDEIATITKHKNYFLELYYE